MQANVFARFALRPEDSEEITAISSRRRNRIIASDEDDEDDNEVENVQQKANALPATAAAISSSSSGWMPRRNAAMMSEQERLRNVDAALRQRKGGAAAAAGAGRIPKKRGAAREPDSDSEEEVLSSPSSSKSSGSAKSVELVDSEDEDRTRGDIRQLAKFLSSRIEQKNKREAEAREARAKRRLVRKQEPQQQQKSRKVISLVDSEDEDTGSDSDDDDADSGNSNGNRSQKKREVVVRKAVRRESSDEADSGSSDESDSDADDGVDHEAERRARAQAIAQRCEALSERLQAAMRNWHAVRSEEGSQGAEEDQGRWGFTQIDASDDWSDSDVAATSTNRSADQPAIITQREIRNYCENLELKNYQLVGVNWMRLLHENGVNGVLADEMGLGKTVQTIAFLAWLRAHDRQLGCHLLVVPASTLSNWENEIAKFCPNMVVETYHGSQQRKRELRHQLSRAFEGDGDVDIVLTTYTCFERESSKDDRRFLERYEFDFLILDEAHCLKNSNSSRYMNLCHITAHHRLLLTGTPVQNDLGELFSLLCFLMPDIFRHKDKDILLRTFGEDLEHMDKPDADAVAENAISKLRRMLAPFVLRRLKSEVQSQFSVKTATVVDVEPLPVQKDAIEAILKRHVEWKQAQAKASREDFLNRVPISDSEAKSLFTELRKAANHPLLLRRTYTPEQVQFIANTLHGAQFFGPQATIEMVMKELDGYCDFDLHQCCLQFPGILGKLTLDESALFESAKMLYLRDTLPRLFADGHRVLLFSQWTRLLDILELLMEHLGVQYLRMDGSTAVRDRQQLIDRFNSEPIPVFLLSTKAGGLGINLTAADTVIIHDMDFNPENDRQAEDRCHRIGQTKPVQVIKLYAKGTVDEDIYRISRRKQQLGAALLAKGGDDDDESENITGILSNVLQQYLAASR